MANEISRPDVHVSDNWRLCERLTLDQASALSCGDGHDPIELARNAHKKRFAQVIRDVEAMKKALINAIEDGRLEARVEYSADGPFQATLLIPEKEHFPAEAFVVQDRRKNKYLLRREPNWSNTTIAVKNLKNWLRAQDRAYGFFFPARPEISPGDLRVLDFMDPDHPDFTPKLALAIVLRQAVTKRVPGKSVKEQMTEVATYLFSHRFGLDRPVFNADGSPKIGTNGKPEREVNKTAIREAVKVANWDDKGGMPTNYYK